MAVFGQKGAGTAGNVEQLIVGLEIKFGGHLGVHRLVEPRVEAAAERTRHRPRRNLRSHPLLPPRPGPAPKHEDGTGTGDPGNAHCSYGSAHRLTLLRVALCKRVGLASAAAWFVYPRVKAPRLMRFSYRRPQCRSAVAPSLASVHEEHLR